MKTQFDIRRTFTCRTEKRGMKEYTWYGKNYKQETIASINSKIICMRNGKKIELDYFNRKGGQSCCIIGFKLMHGKPNGRVYVAIYENVYKDSGRSDARPETHWMFVKRMNEDHTETHVDTIYMNDFRKCREYAINEILKP